MSVNSTADRVRLARRARMLEYLTLAWNAAEGGIAIVLGLAAGSISLQAFGIDSSIEMASGAALLWRMRVDSDVARRERNEKRALRGVGVCFAALAVYIVYESSSELLSRSVPKRSALGIALACAALIFMPWLAHAKKKLSRELNSAALRADAKQSEFCAWLSAILLAGLILNAAFGFWWADPAAALVMVPFIAREAVEALRGEECGQRPAD